MSVIPVPLPMGTGGGFTNVYQRTGLIRALIRAAEIRVADLEARLSEIILGEFEDGGKVITGLARQDDENVIRTELFEARAIEGFYRQQETAWQEIAKANRKSEDSTKGFATNG